MFKRKKQDEVDAVQEIENIEQSKELEAIKGSQLGGKKASHPGSKMFLIVIGGLILMVGGAFTYKAMSITDTGEEEKEITDKVSQVIPTITPRPITPPPIEPIAKPQVEQNQEPTKEIVYTDRPPVTYGHQSKPQDDVDLVRQRMLRSALNSNSSSSTTTSNTGNNGGNLEEGSGNNLSDELEPMKLSGSKAAILPNRDFLLSEGTMLDCILQTRMVTTQPGMTRCVLSRDIYSESGRVVLLDRGSTLTGFYQGGITQGQARIFVQWARVRTPAGVTIELASPGTGPLGEAGVGGYVDNHFWQRFGGSIMLSMIGDLGEWASNKGRSSNDNSIQFSNTSQGVEQAAAEALRNSINIPPTLYKNQGERVSVFLARDLDFSDVYSLHAK